MSSRPPLPRLRAYDGARENADLGQGFSLRMRISVLLYYLPNEYYDHARLYSNPSVHPHKIFWKLFSIPLPTFLVIKRQYLGLLAHEIKCRHPATDLCPKICWSHLDVLFSLDNSAQNIQCQVRLAFEWEHFTLVRGKCPLSVWPWPLMSDKIINVRFKKASEKNGFVFKLQ